MSLKSSISGIRGIIGQSLTPQIVLDYVSAFSSILPTGPILIGRDSRPSGDMLLKLVTSVLNALGRDVVDLGIIPTPVVLYGVNQGHYSGGIVITASHNPSEWNALKLINEKGKFLSPEQFGQLNSSLEKKQYQYVEYKQLGEYDTNDQIAEDHIKTIVEFIDHDKIIQQKYRIAVDTVNGAGGTQVIRLLKKLNCKIVPLNIEETGIFSHPPEPTPANLEELSGLIKECQADVGFALDPDGDRLVLADENGEILSEEYTLALVVKHYLEYYRKSGVVINTSSSRLTETVAKQKQVQFWRVPTGEIHVTEKLEETDSLIGGEGNGGIIVPEINKCRDALVGIALILEYLAVTQKKLSDLKKELPEYTFLKEKVNINKLNYESIEKKILFEFNQEQVDKQDGIRIDLPDAWILVRKSNTEPIIRIFVEAENSDRAQQLMTNCKKTIES
ncbi:MAG: phosphoglucosamine mutase [Spirochaetes bacterium]|nr:phosphoglucosamine mutase [Spirochaetota bacterium]